MNPRYASFLELFPNGANWEFMHFTSLMAHSAVDEGIAQLDRLGIPIIINHDRFTAHIAHEVKNNASYYIKKVRE